MDDSTTPPLRRSGRATTHRQRTIDPLPETVVSQGVKRKRESTRYAPTTTSPPEQSISVNDDHDTRVDSGSTFPFFPAVDIPVHQGHLPYGDPRGGTYPDLPFSVEGVLRDVVDDGGRLSLHGEAFDPELGVLDRGSDYGLDDVDMSGALPVDETESDIEPVIESRRPHVSMRGSGRPERNRRGRPPKNGVSVGVLPETHHITSGQTSPDHHSLTYRGRGRPKRLNEKEVEDIVTEDQPPKWIRRKKKKIAEPTAEFRDLNSKVGKAWLDGNYEEALEAGLQAININPEVFALHGLISEILTKLNRPDDAIGALFAGAHVINDIENWWYVASRLGEMMPSGSEQLQEKMLVCYNQIITIQSDNIAARKARLQIYEALRNWRRVKNDAVVILRNEPADIATLTILMSACQHLDEVDAALDSCEKYLEHCRASRDYAGLNWSFVVDYVRLLHDVGAYGDAVHVLRSTARLLLGRGSEDYWDQVEDDCEWDVEDEPRRVIVLDFVKGRYSEEMYGLGLPIELRIRLGLLRLSQGEDTVEEAMHHLDFLGSADLAEDDIVEYSELIRSAADGLREAGHHSEAIAFYEMITQVPGLLPPSDYFLLAISYEALGDGAAVRRCIEEIQSGENSAGIAYHIGLAKMYMAQGKQDRMWKVIWNVRRMKGTEELVKAGLPTKLPRGGREDDNDEEGGNRTQRSFRHGLIYQPRGIKAQQTEESHKDVVLASLHKQLKLLEDELPEETEEQWLRLAITLLDDFRAQKRFFPKDRTSRFVGFAWEQRIKIPEGESILHEDNLELAPATTYRNIKLEDWVDLICGYALRLAKKHDAEGCWEAIGLAKDANIVYQSTKRINLVRHVALCCAVRLSDEKQVVDNMRALMLRTPYNSTMHKLLPALVRLIRQPPTFFSSGPEQKYITRLIKSVDYHLMTPAQRQTAGFTPAETHRATGGMEGGNPHNIVEHISTLHVLYGHMMMAMGSATTALHYYFRGLASLRKKRGDQGGASTLYLCIAIAYLGVGFKRQTINRQHHIQLAMAFLGEYRRSITGNGEVISAISRQEMEYNTGLFWHMLGLHSSALGCYQAAMDLDGDVREEAKGKWRRDDDARQHDGMEEWEASSERAIENFTVDAAYATREIHSVNGNVGAALAVQRRWLVM